VRQPDHRRRAQTSRPDREALATGNARPQHNNRRVCPRAPQQGGGCVVFFPILGTEGIGARDRADRPDLRGTFLVQRPLATRPGRGTDRRGGQTHERHAGTGHRGTHAPGQERGNRRPIRQGRGRKPRHQNLSHRLSRQRDLCHGPGRPPPGPRPAGPGKGRHRPAGPKPGQGGPHRRHPALRRQGSLRGDQFHPQRTLLPSLSRRLQARARGPGHGAGHHPGHGAVGAGPAQMRHPVRGRLARAAWLPAGLHAVFGGCPGEKTGRPVHRHPPRQAGRDLRRAGPGRTGRTGPKPRRDGPGHQGPARIQPGRFKRRGHAHLRGRPAAPPGIRQSPPVRHPRQGRRGNARPAGGGKLHARGRSIGVRPGVGHRRMSRRPDPVYPAGRPDGAPALRNFATQKCRGRGGGRHRCPRGSHPGGTGQGPHPGRTGQTARRGRRCDRGGQEPVDGLGQPVQPPGRIDRGSDQHEPRNRAGGHGHGTDERLGARSGRQCRKNGRSRRGSHRGGEARRKRGAPHGG